MRSAENATRPLVRRRSGVLWWNALAVVALLASASAVLTSGAWRPQPQDVVADPMVPTSASKALLTTDDVGRAVDTPVVLVSAGLPSAPIYLSQTPIARDIRGSLVDSANEQRWESPDATTAVWIGVVRLHSADHVDDFVYRCPSNAGATIDPESGAQVTSDSSASFGCQEATHGRTKIVVQVTLPRGSPASDVAATTTAVTDAQVAVVESEPGGDQETAELSSGTSAIVTELQRANLALLIALAIMASLPATVADRSTWNRAWSHFPGSRRAPAHVDIEPEVKRLTARSRTLGLFQLAIVLWALRLTEVVALGTWGEVAAIIGAYLGSSMMIRWLTAGQLRTHSARHYRGWALAVLMAGAAVSGGIVLLAVWIFGVATGAQAGGAAPGVTDWQVQAASSASQTLGVAVLLGAFAPLALARRIAQRGLEFADDRAPVLLLRSFADDGLRMRSRHLDRVGLIDRLALRRWERFEEVTGAALSRLGPLVAVGTPGERLPPELGAARVQFSHSEWQAGVARLTEQSTMIAMTLGRSEGLVWEMRRLATTGMLHKTVFLVPPLPRQERQARLAVLSRELGISWPTLDDRGTHRVVLAVCEPLLAPRPVVVVSRGPDDISYDVAIETCARALAVVPEVTTLPLAGHEAAPQRERAGPPPTDAPPPAEVIPSGKSRPHRRLTQRTYFWVLGAQVLLTLAATAAFGVSKDLTPSQDTVGLPSGTIISAVVAASGEDAWIVDGAHQLVRVSFSTDRYEILAHLPRNADVYAHDGTTVFAADSGGGTFEAVNLTTGTVMWHETIPAGTRGLAVVDGRIFRADGDRSLVEVRTAVDGSLVAEVSLPSEPWGVAACGTTVFAPMPESKALAAIDPSSASLGTSRPVPQPPTAVSCWDDQPLAISGIAHRIYRTDSSEAVVFTTLPAPVIAADGEVLAIEGYEQVSVFTATSTQRHHTLGSDQIHLLVGDNGVVFVSEDNILRRYTSR